MVDKFTNIQHHAAKRLSERVGLESSHLKHIRRMIQDGDSEFLFHESLSRSQHRVNYGGQVFRVVYDKRRHLIVTVLVD